MTKSVRVFLVTHGSSDPRSWHGLQNLVQAVQGAYPHWQVGGGCLEGQAQTLAEQLITFTQVTFRSMPPSADPTTGKIYVVPLFLLAGVHTMVDIPEQLQEAQTKLPPSIDLEVLPHLGAHPDLPQILGAIFQAGEQNFPQGFPINDNDLNKYSTKRLIVAHGSRRPGANQGIVELAAQVDASASFWAAAPSWEEQLNQWHQEGIQQVMVLPYFLIPGGITEIIASKINGCNGWSSMNLKLLPLPFSSDTIIKLLNSLG
ncbi:MAG: sirohydrochlorin chelatase [Pseudanabaenaceae cyanobacterium]